ncbi:hypothetical protein [Polyangium spumosum]|uniref:Uncharacterized protein n=1 Tax=Polyangium spumosum TaxID=889282 RepID=A0A6N7PV05_9BACT|nr:hypothetical protein [Polyangium spumosum]MRG94636.1 hypothetical protein [Polyangium spumosum]
MKLLNVLNESSSYVGVDLRPTFLTMVNVTGAMIAMARERTADPPRKAVAEAVRVLERGALMVMKELASDDVPLLPSTHYDLDAKYSLKGSKRVFLDVVADALEGRVHPDERETDGKFEPRLLDEALATKTPNDEAGKRAKKIALRILFPLVTNAAFAKLLMRPAVYMRIVEDRRRLARAIRRLMKLGNATVVQVARAVLYVFGASTKSLKNSFSPKLVEEWETSRKGGVRRSDTSNPA